MKKSIAIMLMCSIMLQCFFCFAEASDYVGCGDSTSSKDLLSNVPASMSDLYDQLVAEYEYLAATRATYNGSYVWSFIGSSDPLYVCSQGHDTGSWDCSFYMLSTSNDIKYVMFNESNGFLSSSLTSINMLTNSNVNTPWLNGYYYWSATNNPIGFSFYGLVYGKASRGVSFYSDIQIWANHDVVDIMSDSVVMDANLDVAPASDFTHSIDTVGASTYLVQYLPIQDANVASCGISYRYDEDSDPITKTYTDFSCKFYNEELTEVRIDISSLLASGKTLYITQSQCIEMYGYPMYCNDPLVVEKDFDNGIVSGGAYDDTEEDNDKDVTDIVFPGTQQTGNSIVYGIGEDGAITYRFPDGASVMYAYETGSTEFKFDLWFGILDDLFIDAYISATTMTFDELLVYYSDSYDYLVYVNESKTMCYVYELEGGLQRRILLALCDGWEWLAVGLQDLADQNALLYKLLFNQYTSFYHQLVDIDLALSELSVISDSLTVLSCLSGMADQINTWQPVAELDSLRSIDAGINTALAYIDAIATYCNNVDGNVSLIYMRLGNVLDALNNLDITVNPSGGSPEADTSQSIWQWIVDLIGNLLSELLDIFGDVVMFLVDILREAVGSIAGLFGYYERFDALFDDHESTLYYFSGEDEATVALMDDVRSYFSFVSLCVTSLPAPLYAFMIVSLVCTFGMFILRRI